MAADATINTSPLTITKTGAYLVKFSIAHCGANSIISDGAYWLATLRTSNDAEVTQISSTRAQIAIPMAKTWDFENNAIGIYSLAPGTYYAQFLNKTGIQTHTEYNSAIRIYAKYLGSV